MKNEMIKMASATQNQRMTSVEIAELTGKLHKHVMRAIRNMEAGWEKVNGTKFGLVEYQDQKGELRPCYSLNKMECLYIATKFNDEARARLVTRWGQLERERIQQTGLRRLMVTDSDVMDEAERIVGRQLLENNAHSDDCLTMTEIAKVFNMNASDMNSFLCDKGIQSWSRGQYRLREEYESMGLAEDRLFIYYSRAGKKKERTYLVWTQRGLDFIESLVKWNVKAPTLPTDQEIIDRI